MIYTQLISLAAKKILEKAEQYKWSLQGLGMLRLYLSPEVRLHVWSSEYTAPNVSTIHDHPWDLQSLILSGRLVNQRYRQVDQTDYNYMCQRLMCGTGGGLCEAPFPVRLWKPGSEVYNPGSIYWQRHDEIHESIPDDGTVTIITRKTTSDPDHAKVFWPIGKEWGSAEPREATPQEVKEITQVALEKWNGA